MMVVQKAVLAVEMDEPRSKSRRAVHKCNSIRGLDARMSRKEEVRVGGCSVSSGHDKARS